MRACSLVALTTLLALTAGADAASEARKKASDVQMNLQADTKAVVAGTPFHVAIILETNKDWHIYWKNPGDSGMTTKFTLNVPAGFKVEMLDFPMPIEFTQAGDLVAYGYTGRTVFLARVTPPKDLVDQKVTVEVNASWLSCKDVCVPGGAKASLELPVTPNATELSANVELVEQAKAAIPEPAAPADLVSAITPESKPDAQGGKGSFGLRISWKKEVKDVAVFPLSLEGLEVSGLKVENQKDQSRVSLNARVLSGQKLKEKKLGLLITYKDAAGKRHGYYSDLDLSALADGAVK